MALKLETETLDDVDEQFRGLYTQSAEGEPFVLAVEGLPDVKGLKQGLDRERRTVREQKEELSKFKGFDLDEYKDLQERAVALQEHDPEKVKGMIDKRVADNNKAWELKYGELDRQLQGTRGKLSTVMVSDELRRVGADLGVLDGEAMNDFVTRGSGLFKVSDEGSVVAMKGDEIVYGESGVEPLTMREFGKTLSTTATHLFKSSGGGGADNTGNGKARGTSVRSKADLITNQDKASFIGKNGRTAYLEVPATSN